MTTRRFSSWIRNGAPYSDGAGAAEPKLTRLEVYPPMAIMPVDGEHRLLVTAHFSDGHTEDYTHQALYTSNDRRSGVGERRRRRHARNGAGKLRFWFAPPARSRALASA